MRKEVFDEYYKEMAKIINYKETDKNGNERKLSVSVAEAEKHPGQYTVYECKLGVLKGKKFAFDPELVQKHYDTLKMLTRMIPSEYSTNMGRTVFALSDLLDDSKETATKTAVILGESFFAMAKSCNVLEDVVNPFGNKKSVERNYQRTNCIKI